MSLVVYILALVIAYLLYRWHSSRLPDIPGPIGLPVLGYLPFLGKKLNITLADLSHRYGPVYQIQIGNRRMVVVCGQKAIREALLGQKQFDFAGRPPFKQYEGFGAFGEPGYLPHHRAVKRVTLKAMNLFGDERKTELQSYGQQAVDLFVHKAQEHRGQAVDVKALLYWSTWVIMGHICYGDDFDVDDPEVHEILRTAEKFGWAVGLGVLYDYLPWTKVFFKKQLEEVANLFKSIDHQSRKLAAKNFKTWDGKTTRNMADFLFLSGKEDGEMKKLDDDYIQELQTSLFGAGFGTIASMTRWTLALLYNHPEWLEKCRAELDQVCGRKYGIVTLDDQPRLPVCTATIAEAYRYSSMSAIGILHMSTKEGTISGYRIPENTPMVFHYETAHFDPDYFTSPHKFDPARYLDDATGQVRAEMLELNMPYGLGQRRCGGEYLAKKEIFIFVTSIIHKLEFTTPPGEKIDPHNYMMTLGKDLHKYKMIFTDRHH